ncbi:MAG: hypothetical protein J0I06_11010 [Planctomycetes bacterium]|nr:hypothetical protein [Planctomycetota bacterium]
MSLAVVVCPACRGASRVTPSAIGQMVSCPRCQTPFVAEEDVPIVHPVARTGPSRPAAAAAVPVAPPQRRRRLPFEDEPEPAPAAPKGAEVPDPEHDPHARPVAGLPVSVLVGLALLPFGIPLLWKIAPFLTGLEAVLSMAVPVSLAVAASALCLGVVYTIDWTAATRVKGVLMLVGLAYLSAAGLFFLKRDLMDRVRGLGDGNEWTLVELKDGNCRTKMPGRPLPGNDENHPLKGLVPIAESRRARCATDFQDGYDYVFAVSKADPVANRPDDAWFDRVGEKLKSAGGKPVGEPKSLKHQERPDAPGRQWTFELGDGGSVRIVRVFAIKGRVYYLSAEGPGLRDDDEDYGRPFFGEFSVNLN